MKKGKLRFVANCFPHHGYIWNYGALPQVQFIIDFVKITKLTTDNLNYRPGKIQMWLMKELDVKVTMIQLMFAKSAIELLNAET